MQFSQDLGGRRKYKQVLAQLNFYMDQLLGTGYILSDIELVAASPIPELPPVAIYVLPMGPISRVLGAGET